MRSILNVVGALPLLMLFPFFYTFSVVVLILFKKSGLKILEKYVNEIQHIQCSISKSDAKLTSISILMFHSLQKILVIFPPVIIMYISHD